MNETTRIQWWLRIRLGLSPTPCRPIAKVVFWFPIDDFTLRSRILGYDVGADDRLTWWTMKAPTRLRLAGDPWVHSHRARYAGLLILRNGPRTPWELSPDLPADCSRTARAECSGLDALRSHLFRQAMRLPPGQGSLYCQDNLHANTTALATTPGGATIQIDLPGQVVCASGRDSELQQGDMLTVLAFTRAVYLPEADPFQQHTLVFSHAELPPYDSDGAVPTGEGDTGGRGRVADTGGGERGANTGGEDLGRGATGADADSWDPAQAVFVHPLPENNDEYGVWHLPTGKIERPTLLKPPPLRT